MQLLISDFSFRSSFLGSIFCDLIESEEMKKSLWSATLICEEFVHNFASDLWEIHQMRFPEHSSDVQGQRQNFTMISKSSDFGPVWDHVPEVWDRSLRGFQQITHEYGYKDFGAKMRVFLVFLQSTTVLPLSLSLSLSLSPSLPTPAPTALCLQQAFWWLKLEDSFLLQWLWKVLRGVSLSEDTSSGPVIEEACLACVRLADFGKAWVACFSIQNAEA